MCANCERTSLTYTMLTVDSSNSGVRWQLYCWRERRANRVCFLLLCVRCECASTHWHWYICAKATVTFLHSINFIFLAHNTFSCTVTKKCLVYNFHHLCTLVGLVRFYAYEISVRKWNVNRESEESERESARDREWVCRTASTVAEAQKWQSSECVSAHLKHFGWIENCSVKSIELFIHFVWSIFGVYMHGSKPILNF